jgi:hypothetical protein
MRRWNPLYLVPLLVVVLAAVVFITPPGASAHSFPSTSTNFKGKIVAKNSDTHYFVLSFTCSPSGNTGKWTYEVSSTSSFTGTVDWTSCSVSSSGGLVTLNGSGNLVGCGGPCTTNPTLTLALTNIVAAKTFFNVPTPTINPTMLCTSSATSAPCLDIKASGFSSIDDFSSQPQCLFNTPPSCPTGFPFATLNLSAR